LLPAEAGGSTLGSAAISSALGTRTFFAVGRAVAGSIRSSLWRASIKASPSPILAIAWSPPLVLASATTTWRTAAM
jgi:hypothetical protein